MIQITAFDKKKIKLLKLTRYILQLTMSISLNFETGLVCIYIYIFHFLTIIGLLNIHQTPIEFKLVHVPSFYCKNY